MKKKQIIALIACMIVGIAGFSGVYLSEQSEKEQQAKQQTENSQVAVENGKSNATETPQIASREETQKEEKESQKPETSQKVATQNPENVAELAGESAVSNEDQEQTVATAKEDTLHFTPEEGLTWPLEGNVLLDYSMDSTIYFQTLDQYRYNPAMVIGGDVNSKVKLIASGKIKEISTNEETGCTVVQDLGDGYEAIYGQLKEVNYEVGDLVEQGQVVGYVSEPTKYYSMEGSNLYFSLQKDGEPVNPLDYFE